ncbi:MAG: hypothetical protein M5T52_15535 [Ignavibacteriaceae bacterium]|nr:hypothetical protein [Ignavibacteriaceae bacterium]
MIELREGVVLNDPLLRLFNPIDLTWATFALIYVSIILFLLNIIKQPEKLMIAIQTYVLMVFLRGIAMYLTPFNAPDKIILLHESVCTTFWKG